MSNPRLEPKYGRCRVCDRPLGKAGECWFYPTHKQESRPGLRVVGEDTKTKPGVETMDEGTVTIEIGGEEFATTVDAMHEAALAMKSGGIDVDKATGEVRQRTLDDTIFQAIPRSTVPTVKVSFSGSVELSRSAFEEYFTEPLKPGREVSLRVAGFIPAPHAKWVKRKVKTQSRYSAGGFEGGETEVFWEHEGAVGIKVTDLGEVELGGERHGE